jgi:N4-gp56 family major capsid protein
MGLGTAHVTKATAASFIPAIWSDEVIAGFKKKLVMANLVKSMSFVGKKGDTLHIPAPTRGVASAKAASTQVTLQAATESERLISINKHFEYSRVIEDIVEVQALSSLRGFYTQDAGYALARQIDTDLINLGRGVQGGGGTNVYEKAYSGADGTTLYVAGANSGLGAITDVALRRSIQRLDDADVPMEDRFLLVPPSAMNSLRGTARFTEQAFVGNGNAIKTGQVGDLYGTPVYVSTNVDTTSGTTPCRVVLLAHKDWAVLAMQKEVRSQTQYKQEYLGNLFTADVLYGIGELRDDSAVAIAVPA